MDQRTPSGGFLQISGLRVVYDLKASPTLINNQGELIAWGNRVREVSVFKAGEWRPLEPGATYLAAVSAWLAKGGDKHIVFKTLKSTDSTTPDTDATASYIRHLNGQIDPRLDGRIKLID